MDWKKLSRKIMVVLVIGFALSAGYLAGLSRAERQPHMRAALDNLKAAERPLTMASQDKGGHRKTALKYTRKAITEVRKGVEFDNKHIR